MGPPFRITDFTVSTEKTEPTHQYVLVCTKTYSPEAAKRESSSDAIVHLDELDSVIADRLEQVIRDNHVAADDIPDGLPEVLSRYEFFVWNRRSNDESDHYGVALHELDPTAPPALEFSATLCDEIVTIDNTGVIEFAVRNTSDEIQFVESGVTPPFHLLIATECDGDREFALWTDYDGISITQDRYAAITAEKITPVASEETVSRRYELRANTATEEPGSGLVTGEFCVRGTLTYAPRDRRTGCGAKEIVKWQIRFSIEE